MPVSVSPAKDGLLEVATACGIETSVPETITPVPAVSVVMFALPSKLIPLIVLAVARMVVVAEFESMERLHAWHSSDEYQALVSLRDEGSDQRMVAYEAMPLPSS